MNLTTEQQQALNQGRPVEIQIEKQVYILLRKEDYEATCPPVEYDDSEWTEDEMNHLAAQSFDEADNAGPIP